MVAVPTSPLPPTTEPTEVGANDPPESDDTFDSLGSLRTSARSLLLDEPGALAPLPTVVKVLLVEDSIEDAVLVRAFLDSSDTEFDVTWAKTLAAGVAKIQEAEFHVVLLDLGLPDSQGAEGVRTIIRLGRGAPVLVLSDGAEDEVGLPSVQNGAQDFVSKSQLTSERLQRTIHYALERRRLEQDLERRALLDPLTGAYNRGFFDDAIERVARRRERAQPLALIFIDLDKFKEINDTWGHQAGDELLKEVARRFQGRLRATDLLCRLGGDEFAVILDGIRNPRDGLRVANALLASLDEPIDLDVTVIRQRASLGVATQENGEGDPAALVRAADEAMYAAKQAGRGRIRCSRKFGLDVGAEEELKVEELIPGAVSRGELGVEFQPVVDMETGAWRSVEALVRWSSPSLGREVTPGEFLPLAEDRGALSAIGAWVLDHALDTLVDLRRTRPALRRSLNVRASELDNPRFVARTLRALADKGLPPAALTIEMTEAELSAHKQIAIPALTALHEAGVSISLDEFCGGGASLIDLAHLPVEELKLCRSMVAKSTQSVRDARVIQGAHALGVAFGLEVVAAGVETHEQRTAMEEAGCRYAQGFLFQRPTTAEALSGGAS